jgi:hypothetical protein
MSSPPRYALQIWKLTARRIIVGTLGYDQMTSLLLTATPYLLVAICFVGMSYLSDVSPGTNLHKHRPFLKHVLCLTIKFV